MPFATSSFLLLVVRPGAPSSVLAPSSDALVTSSNGFQPKSAKGLRDRTLLIKCSWNRLVPQHEKITTQLALGRTHALQSLGTTLHLTLFFQIFQITHV